MSINYLVNILLIIYLVVMLNMYRKVHGFWLNPTCIFISFWVFYISIPLIVVFDGPINAISILYIFCFLLFFGMSSFLFNWNKAAHINNLKSDADYKVLSSSLIKAMFYSLFLISLFSNIYYVNTQGFSFIYAIKNIGSVGASIAEMRYTGTLTVDVLTKISNFCVYFLVYFGGLLYAFDKYRKRYIIITFIPIFLILLLQSSKGLLFYSIFLFYGCVLLKKICINELSFLSCRMFYKIIVVISLLIPFVAFSFLSRGLTELSLENQILGIYKFFASYSSGHLYAFSAWFTERYFNDNYVYDFDQRILESGLYTFKSFFSLFDVGNDINIGVYEEYVGVAANTLRVNVYSHYVDSGEIIVSNIYTVFRGLISDYTLVGSLMFAFFSGLVINFVFYNLLVKRFSTVSFVIFPFFVACSYQTYIISSFTWITIPLAIISVWFFLFFLKQISK